MDIIFSTVRNAPDMRENIPVMDHYQKMAKSAPDTKRRARGPIIPAVGSLIGKPRTITPSYSDIEDTNTIHIPGNYDVLITAEITPGMDVLLNGVLIASAPEYKQMVTGKTKKLTQTERARFCRGVIWWLMNDETCLKDKLQEIGYSAPIVAMADPITVSEPIPVTLPAVVETFEEREYTGRGQLNMFSNEAITGYPHTKITEESTFYHEQLFNEEITDLKNAIEEDLYSMGSPLDSIMLENEYNRGEEIELYDLTYPAIVQNPAMVIRSWCMPHLRVSIVEEALS